MSVSGSQRYNFEELREQINNELLDEHMPEHLYRSTDGIMRVINAIVKTKGQDWARHVLNSEGKPLLTQDEQVKFTEAFQPYLKSIIDFFGGEEMEGGAYKPDITEMSDDFLKTKAAQRIQIPSVDDLYSKIYHKIENVNSSVNEYASKYGVLKLEKEHDLEDDVRVIPAPAAIGISNGVLALSTVAGFPIPPNVTMDILSKIKVPFRTIIFTIYLIVDIARLAISITGPSLARKILSILLAILELLKGDWKKALLSIIGYYGMIPLLIGELLKVFLTLFRMFSPQIQNNIIFGSLDAVKSLSIGLLLSIFQVTAPEKIRLPLIAMLEKVAEHKAKMDGILQDIGLSARPDYLSPTWADLNNIQAVMSDDAYICSCEFRQLVEAINQSAIIRIVLEILRIPANEDMIVYKCGKEPCKDFVTTVVKEAKNATDAEKKADAPFSVTDLKSPDDLDSLASITSSVNGIDTKGSNTTSAITGAINSALTSNKNNKPESEEAKPAKPAKLAKPTGGRILHSRMKKIIA